VWDRYSGNEKYLGGIVSFSIKQFEDINGFPNNFWGWGGEDDEMKKRIDTVYIYVY
jgi:predicted glycosyltransferase involved in capsule biosynthesis